MQKKLGHILLPNNFRKSDSYVSASKGFSGKSKSDWGRDRKSHGNKILSDFDRSIKDQYNIEQNFYFFWQ